MRRLSLRTRHSKRRSLRRVMHPHQMTGRSALLSQLDSPSASWGWVVSSCSSSSIDESDGTEPLSTSFRRWSSTRPSSLSCQDLPWRSTKNKRSRYCRPHCLHHPQAKHTQYHLLWNQRGCWRRLTCRFLLRTKTVFNNGPNAPRILKR